MSSVTTRLEEVQQTLGDILPPNAILCGQSLNGDLNALKVRHLVNFCNLIIAI